MKDKEKKEPTVKDFLNYLADKNYYIKKWGGEQIPFDEIYKKFKESKF